MEDYRKKVIWGMFIGGAMIAAALILFAFNILVDTNIIAFPTENKMLLSFQSGLLCGIGLVALVTMIKYAMALKNPQKLQLMYNEEYDERKRLIAQKAGMPMAGINSVVMIMAGIIAGYFNTVVFTTLIAAAVAQSLISLTAKVYYSKTI
jgi:hypothetical protein